MIHLKLDLSSPAELEAFGVFCTSVATARRAEPPRRGVFDLLKAGAWAAVDPTRPEAEEQEASILKTATEDAAARTEGQNIDSTERRESVATAPTRERGKPSAGHARRTKAEIAEDDAAAKTGIEIVSQTGVVAEEIPLISTGEERLSPEDTPEDAAADAADEAAETAATKTDKLTTEDVRNGMGIYVTKYGIEAIQLDGLEVFNRVLGPCPLKNEKGEVRTWKVSDLPDDQAVLKRIVDGFAEMTSLNPFKRTAKVA